MKDERKDINWHSSDDDEYADIYLDALRGKRVIRFALIAVAFLFLILTYILCH